MSRPDKREGFAWVGPPGARFLTRVEGGPVNRRASHGATATGFFYGFLAALALVGCMIGGLP